MPPRGLCSDQAKAEANARPIRLPHLEGPGAQATLGILDRTAPTSFPAALRDACR